MLHSPAAHRILILDCCFSGDVVPVTGVTWALLGQAATEGAEVLVSAPPSPVYFSRPRETYTAFTGALIAIMRNGIPGGPQFLTLGTIYGPLLYALASRGLPRPQQSGTGTAGQLALARNPAYHRQQQNARPDAGQPPPQAARGRRGLTALAATAVLGISMLLAGVTQRQAGHAPQADPRPVSAISFGQVSLSEPASFTVDVTPAAVLDPATRTQAIGHIISGLDQQLAARHLLDKKVGLVQVFASGAITGIARSGGRSTFGTGKPPAAQPHIRRGGRPKLLDGNRWLLHIPDILPPLYMDWLRPDARHAGMKERPQWPVTVARSPERSV